MGFTATHVVPESGLSTWPAPDPRAPLGPRLDPHLPVQVLEVTPNGWARVLCANGWSAWVDAARLGVPTTAPAAPAVAAAPTRTAPVVPAPAAPVPAPASMASASASASAPAPVPPRPAKRSRGTAKVMGLLAVVVLGGLRVFQMARSDLSVDAARRVSVVGIAVMVVMGAISLRGARLPARVRTPFEIGRALCSLGAVFAISFATKAEAPPLVLLAAIVGGGAAGVAEGASMRVVHGSDGRRYSRRALLPMAVSTAGLIVAAWGAFGGTGDIVKVGQFAGMAGVGLMLGVPIGRSMGNGAPSGRNPQLAGRMGMFLLAAALLPLAALVVDAGTASAAGTYDGTYTGKVESGLEGRETLGVVTFTVADDKVTGSFQMAANGRNGAGYACTAVSGTIDPGDLSSSEGSDTLTAEGTVLLFVTGTIYDSRAELDADPCTTPASAANGESYEADVTVTVAKEGFLVVEIAGDGPLGSYRLSADRTSGGPTGGGTGQGSGGGTSKGTGGSGGTGSSAGSTPKAKDVPPEDAAAAAAGTIVALGAAGLLTAAEAGAAQSAIDRGEVPADVLAALDPTVRGRGGSIGPVVDLPPVPPPPPPLPAASPPAEETIDDLLDPRVDVPTQLADPVDPADPLAGEADPFDPTRWGQDEVQGLEPPPVAPPVAPPTDAASITDGELGAVFAGGDAAIAAGDGPAAGPPTPPGPRDITGGEVDAALAGADAVTEAADPHHITEDELGAALHATEHVAGIADIDAKLDADARAEAEAKAKIWKAVMEHDAQVADAQARAEAAAEDDPSAADVRDSVDQWAKGAGDRTQAWADGLAKAPPPGPGAPDLDAEAAKAARAARDWAEGVADTGPDLDAEAAKTGRAVQGWADGLAKDPAAVPTPKPAPLETTIHGDGSIEQARPGGGETRIDADGVLTQVEPDGTAQVAHPDGTIENLDRSGKVVSTSEGPAFDPDKVRIEMRGGTDAAGEVPGPPPAVEQRHPNGTSTRLDPEGRLHLVEPDGSSQVQHPDGRIEDLDAKGNVVKTTDGPAFDPDELRTQMAQKPGAAIEQVHANGSVSRMDRDGAIHVVDADGSSQVQHPGGQVDQLDASGKVVKSWEGSPFDPAAERARMAGAGAGGAGTAPTDPIDSADPPESG